MLDLRVQFNCPCFNVCLRDSTSSRARPDVRLGSVFKLLLGADGEDFARLGFDGDSEGAAANFAVGDEALGGDAGIDGEVEGLAAEGAGDWFGNFHFKKRLPGRAASSLITRMSGTATRAGARHTQAFDIAAYLETTSAAVNRALDKSLPAERVKPATIHKAMRYSLFAGGKRLRPALCIAAAEACGGEMENALPYACAVECIHTYSLIHDDLPAMDNDDYRRGKLTNHKVFGEGIAILAGDGLLTQAFEILVQGKSTKRYSHQAMVLELAHASGSLQLIAGQVADLEGEGKSLSLSELRYIHERKTSALLRCAVRLGGMSANCAEAQIKALPDIGYYVGLAFQVIDDVLGVTQTTEQLGKTAGKDIAAQKATYPALVGLDKSREIAATLTKKAYKSLEPFKGKAVALEALA